ncbi:MAG: hypothetical protein ACREMC_09405 [Gemmatimonadales bacterium]
MLEQLVLTAVPARAAEGDAGDAGAEQGRLHLRETLGSDDGRDELHTGLPVGAR